MTWSTSLIAQENNIILESHAMAPFRGVLVPEENFRYYMRKTFEADRYSRYLAEPQETIERSPLDIMLPFGIGFSLGAAAIILIRK